MGDSRAELSLEAGALQLPTLEPVGDPPAVDNGAARLAALDGLQHRAGRLVERTGLTNRWSGTCSRLGCPPGVLLRRLGTLQDGRCLAPPLNLRREAVEVLSDRPKVGRVGAARGPCLVRTQQVRHLRVGHVTCSAA